MNTVALTMKEPTHIRHFLDLAAIEPADLRRILNYAKQLKATRGTSEHPTPLTGKKLAMIFEKNSTRTRISFEVGMVELGGYVLSFNGNELQLGRGETVADTAKVVSRYVDAIMLRCHSHQKLEELAANATIPVINGLTEYSHPCQIMADILTAEEHWGDIAGKTIAWVGDGNNMAHSWIMAAATFCFTLRLACPDALRPDPEVMKWAKNNGAQIILSPSPQEAVTAAHAVVTDTWVSMGQENLEAHTALLAPYQVNDALMAKADANAIFLHCLPAHRGEEVTQSVIDGPQSRVFDEAENRLHAQKAILCWCFSII